ncbi:MAG: NADH-quinone oxidoreductase subunit A [Candidatus Njordarchaeota archaeon]
MGIIEILIAIVLPFIILLIIYSLGKKSKRETGREPYVSGHKFPSIRIPYKPMWLFYISYFILWDIIVIFILFIALEASLLVIASLAILIITMIMYPVRMRRVIKK